MVMGRRPQPTALKIAKGTHRPDKMKNGGNDPTPKLLETAPPAPETLGYVGQSKWAWACGNLIPLGILSANDLDALYLFCACWDELAECDAALKERGPYITTDTGYVAPHPAVSRRFRAIDNIRRFMQEFGMTPASRSAVAAIQKPATGVRTRTRESQVS